MMQAEQILYSKINQPIATHCILQKKKWIAIWTEIIYDYLFILIGLTPIL